MLPERIVIAVLHQNPHEHPFYSAQLKQSDNSCNEIASDEYRLRSNEPTLL